MPQGALPGPLSLVYCDLLHLFAGQAQPRSTQPYQCDTTSLLLFVGTAHQTPSCPSKLIWHALPSMKTSLILLLKLTTLFSFTRVLCTRLFGRLHSLFFLLLVDISLSPCKLLKQHHWLSSSYKQWKFIPHSSGV